MKPATAIVCVVLGAAAIAGSMLLLPHGDTGSAHEGELVFPGIAAKLADAAEIDISGSDKEVKLVRQDGHWGIAERDFYPAQPQKLRQMLEGLTELKLLEARTADPALLGRLGVDDPSTPGSTAVLLKVDDAHGDVLAQLILGHRSMRSRGGLPESVYVRRPGDTQSWLAEGSVPTDSDPLEWVARDIADIPRGKIAKVDVTRGADRLSFTVTAGKIALDAPPPGKIDTYHVDDVGQALEHLTLADVRKGAPPGTPEGRSVFTTTDGLVVTVDVTRDGKTVWASFAASGPGADAYKSLAGWAFEIPEWRETSLLPKASDLVTAEPAKASAASTPPAVTTK